MQGVTDRQIRVFISSTFRDMQDERDHLVKFIFPQLRKICEDRNIAWSEVDLRWGITNEQSAEGQVLPICLEEIKRCRPYFIGILGERYGWIPDEIAPELQRMEPWLTKHLEHSVTELEIIHGVLNDSAMKDKALFYFRDPEFIKTLPPEQFHNFTEILQEDEVKKYGLEIAQQKLEDRKHKLTSLKTKLRESGILCREGFQSPEQLGEWVLKDMTSLIDREYPQASRPSPLKQEHYEHEIHAAKLTDLYFGGDQYFQVMDDHVTKSNLPVVVVGESGCGKSALLANWGLHYRQNHPADLVFFHFIGATARSSDWSSMLRRVLGELKEQFEIDEEIPTEASKLREVFQKWLNIAGKKKKVVLIIDALDQLEDMQGAKELTWLPTIFPPNTCLVCSTLPGKTLEAFTERKHFKASINPLSRQDREDLLHSYLKKFAKELNQDQVNKIVEAHSSKNPLSLRILLNELRQFGIHEKLDEIIEYYLSANSIPELISRVLSRCETDFEKERKALVRDALSFLWAARHGISEAELMDLLGEKGKPLSKRVWAPLSLSIEEFTINRSGYINFSHEYLTQAVETKYLSSDEIKRRTHQSLVRYFKGVDSPRKFIELPWQLQEAGDWDTLFAFLCDLDFFKSVWSIDRFDVYRYWASIEKNSNHTISNAYEFLWKKGKDFQPDTANWIEVLLKDSGYIQESIQLNTKLEKYYREANDNQGIISTLNNRALLLKSCGENDEALAVHEEQEKLCREVNDLFNLQIALGNKANILQDLGYIDEALAMIEQRERICQDIGDQEGLQAAIGNRATILKMRGQWEEALTAFKKQEQICHETGNEYGLQIAWNNQGLILKDTGRVEEAIILFKKSEQLCRKIGHLKGLQTALNNLGIVEWEANHLDEAMRLFKGQEMICRSTQNLEGLQSSLGNQALIYSSQNKFNQALKLLDEKAQICMGMNYQDGLQNSLGNQALIYEKMGYSEDALLLYKKQEEICRALENLPSLQHCLKQQAYIQRKLGQFKQAFILLQEKETICTQIKDWYGVIDSLVNQADIYGRMGDGQRQFSTLSSAMQLAEKHGFHDIAGELKRYLRR